MYNHDFATDPFTGGLTVTCEWGMMGQKGGDSYDESGNADPMGGGE